MAFKARSLVKTQPTLPGNAAAVQDTKANDSPGPAQQRAVKEACRAFARDGNCKFHVPAEGRFCRHSHGTAADKQNAQDKATFKAKNPGKGGGDRGGGGRKGKHGRTPKGPDSGYSCGSKLHFIDQCTAGPSGHLGIAATPPSVPATNPADQETWKTLRAFADRLSQRDNEMTAATDALHGQTAEILGPPSAYDDIRLMDDELASLFRGGMGR